MYVKKRSDFFQPNVSYYGTLLENPTLGIFAGLEVMATNLLSIFYTDNHNIKTVYKSLIIKSAKDAKICLKAGVCYML